MMAAVACLAINSKCNERKVPNVTVFMILSKNGCAMHDQNSMFCKDMRVFMRCCRFIRILIQSVCNAGVVM